MYIQVIQLHACALMIVQVCVNWTKHYLLTVVLPHLPHLLLLLLQSLTLTGSCFGCSIMNRSVSHFKETSWRSSNKIWSWERIKDQREEREMEWEWGGRGRGERESSILHAVGVALVGLPLAFAPVAVPIDAFCCLRWLAGVFSFLVALFFLGTCLGSCDGGCLLFGSGVVFSAFSFEFMSFLAPQAACFIALWDVMACWSKMAVSLASLPLSQFIRASCMVVVFWSFFCLIHSDTVGRGLIPMELISCVSLAFSSRASFSRCSTVSFTSWGGREREREREKEREVKRTIHVTTVH